MKHKLNSLFFQSNLPLLILGVTSILVMIALTIYAVADRSKVHRLTIAAGSQKGESYRFSQEMAKVVAQYEPRIQITVRETDGTGESLKLLAQGEAHLAMAQADIPAPPSARLVSYLFPDMFQLIVTERSGIRQVADLRGKRVGVPPKGG
ncbi:MAG: TAXI family TRAP transporter solute-binding subunit, partial [Leptolyngbyaceae cyanobacterium bins.59]|nr:TAXI family TRAP transporter solute-binding subunit [Leptolyngbyaceae cyanobacterium bins.59]